MQHQAITDTNIVISSLITKDEASPIVQYMSQLLSGHISPIASVPILAEYAVVLGRPKFHFSQKAIDTLLAFFWQNSELVSPIQTDITLPDPNDLPFFETYIAKQSPATFLVTGNQRHFPEWPYIVTPRQFLTHLTDKN